MCVCVNISIKSMCKIFIISVNNYFLKTHFSTVMFSYKKKHVLHAVCPFEHSSNTNSCKHQNMSSSVRLPPDTLTATPYPVRTFTLGLSASTVVLGWEGHIRVQLNLRIPNMYNLTHIIRFFSKPLFFILHFRYEKNKIFDHFCAINDRHGNYNG